MTRQKMIIELTKIQNRIALAGTPVDILTITALMTDSEVAQHLARYQERA